MIKQSDVTIIIPHLGEDERAEYAIEQCLQSLIGWEGDVLIAANGMYEYEPKHHIKELSISTIALSDQGQCKATNAAVATTNTPWIMVSNDDMVYPPGWFDVLGDVHEPLLKPSLPVCLSPMLIEPRDGAPTFQKQMFGGVGGDFNKQAFLDFAEKHGGEGLRTGFNLPFLMSRDLWDTIGGYDIQYDPWGSNSDSDLEYKIKLAGVQPYQNTNCVVYHFSNTSGTFEPRNHAYWEQNFAKFQDKWGFPRTDEGIWEASFEIPDKGRIYRPEWEGKYAS